MRIGVLTGGGDCPGLNAIIRALVLRAEGHLGHTVLGFRHGWRGVAESDVVDLTVDAVRGILTQGGTVLGGDGTLAAAQAVHEAGVPVIGVPKTIDNDVLATDASVGFDTAVTIATQAIDRVHTTAESHDRVMVVEVMGHHAGWIAASAGIAGGAHVIIVPEEPFDIEEVCRRLRHRHRHGANSSVVVVAEGAVPVARSLEVDRPDDPDVPIVPGAVGERIRREIERRTGFEARGVVLGHTQRGGMPTPFDRLLRSRMGLAAAEAADDRAFGTSVALRDGDIVRVPLADAIGRIKVLDGQLLDAVAILTA